MKTRVLGSTGRKVSEVGLGCWQLGGDWGVVEDGTAADILAASADAGVTFFDTADVYGGGRSESLVGAYLRETDRDIFVATKVGRTDDLYPDGYTAAGLRARIGDSLDRLGVDALDLVQLHCIPTAVMADGAVFEWLRELQAEGLIRAWGASVESMDEAKICLEQEGLASLQIIFNVFRQKPAEEVLGLAAERNVGIIARVPLASGLLSGKMKKDATFRAEDHRNYNRDGAAFNVGETFAGLPFALGVDLAEEIRELMPDGMTMAQASLRWILDHPAVTTVIPGASRPEQARDNAAVSGLPPLGDERHAALGKLYEEKIRDAIRGPY